MSHEMPIPESQRLKSKEDKNDDSLDGALLEFGRRYMYLAIVLMISLMTVPGAISLSSNFTSAKMDLICAQASCDTDTNSSRLSECITDIQSCQIVSNCSGSQIANDSKIMQVFEETSISKFDLVCDRQYLATLPTMLYFLGFMLGCTVYGSLADKFGRLRLMAVASTHLAISTAAASQAPSFWMYCAAQFMMGAGCGGLHTAICTYALEMATARIRHITGFSVHHGWAIGIMLGTLVAYYERHYQWLLLWLSASAVPPILVALLLCESPRWLCSVGRFAEADKSLKRIARFGGKKLSDSFSSSSLHYRQQMAVASALSVQSLQNIDQLYEAKSAGFVDLVRTPGIRRITLCVWFLYFVSAFGFFGISLGIGNLGGNMFLNQLYCAAVEIPARLLGAYGSGHISRRRGAMTVFGASGLCLLITAGLFPYPQLRWLRILTAMIGKFWITIAFNLALLYAAEAFPTVIRSVGIGSSCTLGQAGALLSTLVTHLGLVWGPLPFVIFAVGPLAAVLVAMLMPETKGRQLPDTLLEGEDFGLGQNIAGSVLEIPMKKQPVTV